MNSKITGNCKSQAKNEDGGNPYLAAQHQFVCLLGHPANIGA